jgi:hypothetical protein
MIIKKVDVCNNVEGKTLQTTLEQVKVTGVQGVTVKFQNTYENHYRIQPMVNSSLCELKEETGKYSDLFNKKYLNFYHENSYKEDEQMDAKQFSEELEILRKGVFG